MFKNSESALQNYLAKSQAKKRSAASSQAPAKTGFKSQAGESADGKRKITYDIQKNKGLTAHRKKENRNARVKKRNKYAKAQKKLKSQRAVYEGQQGPYAGEASGIRRNISRSTKLS